MTDTTPPTWFHITWHLFWYGILGYALRQLYLHKKYDLNRIEELTKEKHELIRGHGLAIKEREELTKQKHTLTKEKHTLTKGYMKERDALVKERDELIKERDALVMGIWEQIRNFPVNK